MNDEILTSLHIGTFFRFPDEITGMNALRSAGFIATNEKGNESIITASHHHALDVIGIITRGGEWDDQGNVVVPPTTLDGWHVNYQGAVPDEWQQYAIWPQSPYRIFL